MTRFHGAVGYGETVETAPDVERMVVVEREYYGNIIRPDSRSLVEGDTLNKEISLRGSISIIADAYAYENFLNIKYVFHQGKRWVVTSADVQRPRIILTPGEVYNGDTPVPTTS